MNSDIRSRIERSVKNLPTLPTIYSSLQEAMTNPRVTTDDIAKIIASDQASAFKVLRVVNSPFYGFSGKINTISSAILHLGFNEVRNIVLALSVINMFKTNNIILDFRPVDFWSHSIAVGVATRLVGSAVGVANLENYFLAGILHDVGKLLFFDLAENEYEKVLEKVEEKKCTIGEAEKEILGIDHSSAGRILADRWKLPPSIKSVIENHHCGTSSGKDEQIIASVHVADIFVRMLELGYAGDNLVPIPNRNVWSILNLPEDAFTNMADMLLQDFHTTADLVLSN